MIRPRDEADINGCVSLLREVHLADGYPANWPHDPERWLVGRGSIAAWVADQGGALSGHVALHAVSAMRAWPQWSQALGVEADRLAIVSRLFVSPSRRSRGFGRALMKRAQDHAQAQRLRLALEVAAPNHAAVAFYESQGWRRVGTAAMPPGDQGIPLSLVLFVRGDD